MWGSTGRHGSRGGRISLPAGGDSPREPPHQGGLPGASAPPSFIIINVWANSEPVATGPARNERRETNNHSHTPLCLWRLGIPFILSQILFLFSVLYLMSAGSSTHTEDQQNAHIPTLSTQGSRGDLSRTRPSSLCFFLLQYNTVLSPPPDTNYRLHSIFD